MPDQWEPREENFRNMSQEAPVEMGDGPNSGDGWNGFEMARNGHPVWSGCGIIRMMSLCVTSRRYSPDHRDGWTVRVKGLFGALGLADVLRFLLVVMISDCFCCFVVVGLCLWNLVGVQLSTMQQ